MAHERVHALQQRRHALLETLQLREEGRVGLDLDKGRTGGVLRDSRVPAVREAPLPPKRQPMRRLDPTTNLTRGGETLLLERGSLVFAVQHLRGVFALHGALQLALGQVGLRPRRLRNARAAPQ
jgi:hypothetical protein